MDSLITLASIAPTQWRNGGGTTRELLAWPSSADWQLRLSVADIASDGAFSAYPGVQRWFAVFSGAGVLLQWPTQHSTTVTPTSGVLQFDGAAPPYGQLVDGLVQDFNLMSRSPHAGLLPVQAGQPWQAPVHSAIYGLFACAEGMLHTGDAQHTLPAMSLYYRTTASPNSGIATQPHRLWVFEPSNNAAPLGWWFHFQPDLTRTEAPLV